MTPMIDVVFLLLIYFVMTMEPLDVFANLNVFIPSPDQPPPKEKPDEPPEVIKVGILKDGFQFDGFTVREETLEKYLGKIGGGQQKDDRYYSLFGGFPARCPRACVKPLCEIRPDKSVRHAGKVGGE